MSRSFCEEKAKFKFDKPRQDVYYSCHEHFVHALLLDDEALTSVTEIQDE